MRRIRVSRGTYGQPMSRQHKRVLRYLLISAIALGALYIWTGRVIDPLAISFQMHEAYMNDATRVRPPLFTQSYDWRRAPFVNKIQQYAGLPRGQPHTLPFVQSTSFPETKLQRYNREARRVSVRDEFKRTWQYYKSSAWARDELRPVTGGSLETFGGWGATLVDTLDTLWIMGMKEEFNEAVEAVAAIDFGTTNLTTISVFETTIRYLGGLLSAYDLSRNSILLEKAEQLGEMLYRAFDTPNYTPIAWLNVENTKSADREGFDAERSICLACLGSFTMEFTRLSQLTSQPKFYDLVLRISKILDRTQESTRLPGLWPTTVNAAEEEFNQSRQFSIGALADSTYEYFPKMYALLGGLDPIYKKLYAKSSQQIDRHFLFRPMVPNSNNGKDLLFCGDVFAPDEDDVRLEPQMQHLTCFIGGMFALAGRLFDFPHHVDLGQKLTNGCIFAYNEMPSGIMPESFDMLPCESRESCPWNETAWEYAVLQHYGGKYVTSIQDAVKQYRIPPGFTYFRDKRYLLRPEAIESVFVLYRITGNRYYLQAAWDMFMSISASSRTNYGNGQVLDVTFTPSTPGGDVPRRVPGVRGGRPLTREDNIEDKMESFWTAETLKYFYLIFSPPDMISLDDWVFNTEAHPFRRPKLVLLEAGR